MLRALADLCKLLPEALQIERLGINTIAYAALGEGKTFCSLISGSAPVRVDEDVVRHVQAQRLRRSTACALRRRPSVLAILRPLVLPVRRRLRRCAQHERGRRLGRGRR